MAILTIQQQYEQATQAYHDLNTGRMARVVVDQNGERVEFVAANKTALYNYILQLRALLPAEQIQPRSYAPARFTF